MRVRTAAALLALPVLLAGCSGRRAATTAADTPVASPISEAPSPSSATPSTPVSPAPRPAPSASGGSFRPPSATDTAAASGGPLTVTAVRAGRHAGYDRVVFELHGRTPGVPGWRVAYTTDPREDGSGRPVQVAGAATLAVVIQGVGYPFDTGEQEASGKPVVPAGSTVLRDVVLGGTYEGQWTGWLGLRNRVPFRVLRLADPARVVVDLQQP